MVLLRQKALAEHYLHPRVFSKQLRGNFEDTSCLLKQIDSVLQRIRYLGTTTVPPETRIVALSDMIVQDNKVPNIFNLEGHLRIEFVNIGLPNAIVGEHLHKTNNCPLRQMNAGRLQRLHKAAGETHRYAILIPMFAARTRRKFNHSGISKRLALKVTEQLRGSLIIGPKLAAIH